MIDIISQPAEIRRKLYDQIGLRLGLHPRSVEKDITVRYSLQSRILIIRQIFAKR